MKGINSISAFRAAHAYGLVNEDMIVDLPQEIFKDVEAEEMVVGHVLPMMDSVGRRLQGKDPVYR